MVFSAKDEAKSKHAKTSEKEGLVNFDLVLIGTESNPYLGK